MTEIARILRALAPGNDRPAALATLVCVEGSSYRLPGARLLVLSDGARFGSISGGCLEDDVVLRAQRVLATGRPELVVYDTTAENDLVWGVGIGCHGVVRILIENIPVRRPAWVHALRENLGFRHDTELVVVYGGAGRPRGTELAGASPATTTSAGIFREVISAPPALVIFGAGDDTQPLVRMAKETGWHVTVADGRRAVATSARFPEADVVTAAPVETLVRTLPFDEHTFVVVMTHRYADDLKILRALLPRPLAYLGQLGPRPRTDRLLVRLAEDGVVPDEAGLARFHAPVGLDLGGSTPENVALSILAEVQSRRANRTPINLRDRLAPIHG